MPAISIDTFFACSLMVILVLSAMAGASQLLYPYINNAVDLNVAERYEEIAKYILLSEGSPSNWGQDHQVVPDRFGLAKADSDNPYELDIDKVSRLNSENLHALSYAQVFTSLKMPDVSFRMEIKPVFEVSTSLNSTFYETSETTYQFEISTEKHGVSVQAYLKCYIIAENYLETTNVQASDGRIYLNITLSNNANGPALLVVLAKATYEANIMSFGVCAFAHNSPQPEPEGTFLTLSPLNHVLNASFIYSDTVLSDSYALTFNYNSTLTQTASDNQSATFEIPHYLDSSPTLIVATGWNSSSFFIEWTAYPQIPLQIGANFANSIALSNVYAYTYIITINSVVYECSFWFGGSRT